MNHMEIKSCATAQTDSPSLTKILTYLSELIRDRDEEELGSLQELVTELEKTIAAVKQ